MLDLVRRLSQLVGQVEQFVDVAPAVGALILDALLFDLPGDAGGQVDDVVEWNWRGKVPDAFLPELLGDLFKEFSRSRVSRGTGGRGGASSGVGTTSG